MMNELADRLDTELIEFEKVVDRLLVAERITRTPEYGKLAELLIVDRKKVSKALRFAADMERLMPFSPKFFYETAEGSMGPVQVVRCEFQWMKNIRMVNWERDIYTAARKAVEELEKGE